MKCKLLVTTTEGSKVVGILSLTGFVVTAKAVPGYERLVNAVMEDDTLVDAGTKVLTRASNPLAWFNSLPLNYNGVALRAQLVS